MLKKIVSIKNVGRFYSSAAPGNPQLRGRTLVLGANGFGKTTLCSILRSLQSGTASEIQGRQTLGAHNPPTVELLTSTGLARFDGSEWSRTMPELAVFDSKFVAENVHSGEVVDTEQKRNLYRVIVGAQGVRLANREASLVVASRDKTKAVTATRRALETHLPTGMSLEAFLALETQEGIDDAIALQSKAVEGARQSSRLRERAALSELPVPHLPPGFSELLARRVDDVAADAEAALETHIARHGMSEGGQDWLSKGVRFVRDETCPFCSQDIRGIPIIAAFRTVFGDEYRRLHRQILLMRDETTKSLGAQALLELTVIAERNASALEFWANYCDFDSVEVGVLEGLASAMQALRSAALELLEQKAARPLDAVAEGAALASANEKLDAGLSVVTRRNAAIRRINAGILEKKRSLSATDLTACEKELARLRAIKTRHSRLGKELVAAYEVATREKAQVEARKQTVRTQLDTHTRSIVRPYERRINHYLDAFNAGFRITETGHSYRGGVAASEYQLVINDVNVKVGDRRTPISTPSFKNTLSAGDRTTLALAFFLANLENDAQLGTRVVVFDDPFSSQDAFRRRQTIHEVGRVGASCAQVVVLSHDATFLKQIWEKAPIDDRVALAMLDHRAQGTRITEADLEKACQGRTVTDIDHLQAYLTTGAGELVDVIRKMRVVLEAHCRAMYPYDFSAGDWLGDIVRKIGDAGSTHPAYPIYGDLDRINDYSKEYHHGEDMTDATPDQIDSTELTGFVRSTLQLVNALQA